MRRSSPENNFLFASLTNDSVKFPFSSLVRSAPAAEPQLTDFHGHASSTGDISS
jgi:hypothetical protein